MAAGSEVVGSRREWDDNRRRYGVRLFVTDDMSTNLPVMGAVFTNGEDAADTNNALARRVYYISSDPDAVPGIYYHEVRYMGFKVYST